jgi:hypothetical protein
MSLNKFWRFVGVFSATLTLSLPGVTVARAELPTLEPISFTSSHPVGESSAVWTDKFTFNATFPEGTKIYRAPSVSPNWPGSVASFETFFGRGRVVGIYVYATKPGYKPWTAYWNVNVSCPEPVSIEYKHSGNKTYVYISNPNPFVTYSVPWASVKKDATRQVTSSASRIEIAVLQDSHKPSLTGTYFLKAVYKDSDCPVMEREISTQVGTMQGSVGISSSGGDSFTPGDIASINTSGASRTSSCDWKYFWYVDRALVQEGGTYAIKTSDVGKRLSLGRVYCYDMRDSNKYWGFGQDNIVATQEGGSFSEAASIMITPKPTATPTPTPSRTATPLATVTPRPPVQPSPSSTPPVLNPQRPAPEASSTPRPSVSEQPTPKPSPSITNTPAPVKTVVPKPSSTFANCTALRKRFVNGVARDAAALKRYSQRAKPALNNAVYKANIKLDTDNDGLACER